jgi:hypothetical protein
MPLRDPSPHSHSITYKVAQARSIDFLFSNDMLYSIECNG